MTGSPPMVTRMGFAIMQPIALHRIVVMKTCTKCGLVKESDEFYKNKSVKSGLSAACRECTKARVAAYKDANPEKVRASKKRYYYENNKREIYARQKEYRKENGRHKIEYQNHLKRVGREQYRKECRIRSARYRQRNREKVNQSAREYRWENLEKCKERLSEYRNRPEFLSRRREIYHENPDRERARASWRRARKLQATPAWANLSEIENIYRRAAEISESTGIAQEVDHIVPLKSKLVCGLHCEQNLQIITSSENRAKSNLWWPNMPDGEMQWSFAS